MLSRPKNGWSTLKIGNFSSRVSYLTDVPYECLNACLAALKYNIPLILQYSEYFLKERINKEELD